MMTIIYLVRHGEVYNPNGILYGRLPGFGLSEKGQKQIEQTADFLKNKHIDYIYSSPLLRAKQTAEIIRNKLCLPKIQISKYILEIKTSYQGHTFASLSPDQSEVYMSPEPNDESLEDIAKRLKTFMKILTLRHTGKHIVLVSHGDPLMLMRSIANDTPIAYSAVRSGNGVSYIKHGEVIELRIHEDGKTSAQSIFIPK